MGKAEKKREGGAGEEKKAARPRNVYMDKFSVAYQKHYGLPYAVTEADAVNLDKLLNKSGKLSARMTLEVWDRGIANYLASDLGVHSLKHLCPNFVAYWKQPLDRFGKPREKASPVGGEKPAESYASWHPKFLAAAWKIAQKDKRCLDAIDVLFDEVVDMDELTAFKRLKEIERGEATTETGTSS